jgi:uncharacterized LabA/DUF88 family protein
VDGFNVYHSIIEASRVGPPLKWLNLASLCRSYLYLFGRDATLEGVYYFSAFATWRLPADPAVVNRHKTYIAALEAVGVEVLMGRFKVKQVWCPHCKRYHEVHEEKETDVAIAVKMLELLFTNACDTVVLVTGDTDLVPAIRAARRLFPSKRIACAFPYKRAHAELKNLDQMHFKISRGQYTRHQFSDPVVLPNGVTLAKPQGW